MGHEKAALSAEGVQGAPASLPYLSFGLHDLLLSHSCWPGKQQCMLPNLTLLASPAVSGDHGLLVAVVQASYYCHPSEGGGLKTQV